VSVLFHPEQVFGSAAALDVLADRIEAQLGASRPALTVPPAARDEVSCRAAQTVNRVSASYDGALTDAVGEIRRLATALRSHAAGVVGLEDDSAASFAACLPEHER
jgi:hypothetical protein